MTHRVLLTALCSAVALLATACGGQATQSAPESTSRSTGRPRLLTYPAPLGGGGMYAQITLTLAINEAGCFAAEADGTPIVAPDNWHPTSDGTALVTNTGTSVRVGDVLRAGGGYVKADRDDRKALLPREHRAAV